MKLRRLLCALLAVALAALSLCSCDMLYGFLGEDIPYDLTVHFLDIGQGDSIFIELPNGQTMLIDAAENYYGEGIINYIKNAGYEQIDYLVATHPHSDHIGSMAYIVRNFNVESVYMPKVSANTSSYENLLTAIQKKKLKIKNGKAGVNIVTDNENDVSADIVAPVKIDEENLNNCSIVIKLTYGEASFLFTGDAEKAENASIKADIEADVLKVGHHGSRTSTTEDFLNKVDPEYAVISCGKNNDYGHPHKETMNFLNSCGCRIFRTDQQGTVTVSTNGEDYRWTTEGESIKRAK